MRFWCVVGLLFGGWSAQAQYTNSWINFSQTYYKIELAKDGIYRLGYDELKAAGVPVEAIDPRLIQMFHRGVEQAILFQHLQQPADASFQQGEYLEFYGRRNDGVRDAGLYQPASLQPHQHYNLYSDTSSYFLTWNASPVQGKRMETVDLVNSTNLPKETFHYSEVLTTYHSEYSKGRIYSNYIAASAFDQGEGWTGPVICTLNSNCTGQQDFSFHLEGAVSTGTPTLEILLAGRDNLQHAAEIYAGPNAGSLRLIRQVNFQNFETPIVLENLNNSDIAANGTIVVRVKAIGVGGIRERISVSYIDIKYPRSFDFSSVQQTTLYLRENAGGRSYLEFVNAPSGLRLFDLTDESNGRLIGTRVNGSITSAVVTATEQARKIVATSQVLNASSLKIAKVSFRSILPSAHNYLVVSNKKLMQPALGYPDAVKAFAGYRASAEGGGYDTLTVDVDQLFDQFNFGETSPMGIYEFLRFMTGNGDPKYLFIIGKGREVYDSMYRKKSIPPSELLDLVPTAGTPASDMLFSAGLKGPTHVPALATGRLSASNPVQVIAYLNKIKEVESASNSEPWHKKILHLSGGIQPNELVTFRTYMDGFASIAEGLYLGGNVLTIGKHDPTTVQFIDVSNEVNQGLNFITFFGHSSTTDTDIDIGKVTNPRLNYSNTGLYPAFLVNGCNAGEFFNNGTNFGEDWMLASAKGARNFIANSSFGFDGVLRLYTEMFYRVGFGDKNFLGRGIGDVQQEVAVRFLELFSDVNPIYVAQTQQMVLLGDPAVKLFASPKPDYGVTDESISVSTFDNKPLHALADSLLVEIVVNNFGPAEGKPLTITLKHTLGDGTVRNLQKTFPDVLYCDTLQWTIYREDLTFGGTQQIQVALDPGNQVDEMDENNNTAIWSAFIPLNGTLNLLPSDFSIVSNREMKLMFQNTDLLAGASTYLLEADTSFGFDSPFKKSIEVQGKVLNTVPLTLLEKDSLVYYWRTKLKDRPTDSWETTSFVFIASSGAGWAQLEGPQLTDNTASGLVPGAVPYTLDFKSTSLPVFIRTYGSANPTSNLNGSVQIDHAEYYFSPQGFNCRDNTINLVAFDKTSLVPYRGVAFTFQNSGGRACGKEPQIINSFLPQETKTGNQDDLIQYVDNVGEGDSVVLFSMGDAGFNQWSVEVKNKMEELGLRATDFDALIPGEPVIILARKGAPAGTARILRTSQPDPTTQELQLSEDLSGKIPVGSVRSPYIGPARAWSDIQQDFRANATDAVSVSIYGLTKSGQEDLLFENVTESQSLNAIDAARYAFLRLAYEVADEVELTPAQLRYWMVHFEPAPEGLVYYHAPEETPLLQEGASFSTSFGFANISMASFMDSLHVNVKMQNVSTSATDERSFKIKAPLPGDSTNFVITGQTIGRIGVNSIETTVNPGDQPELYYVNNTITVPDFLEVFRDQTSPVLDVTVNGRYLLNGDFVTPSPTIRIRVTDENQFLPMVDTTGVTILLKYPCTTTCNPTPIYFTNPDVQAPIFDEEGMVVNFVPQSLPDGVYTLLVQAKDRSGNSSGDDYYSVEFQVQSKEGIAFFAPYPNPSPDNFFFEFSVAGPEAPSQLLLQVFDAKGQLVSEIVENDLAPLRVGLNRFQWSAVNSGIRLIPEGIYYYRMKIVAGNEAFTANGKLLLYR